MFKRTAISVEGRMLPLASQSGIPARQRGPHDKYFPSLVSMTTAVHPAGLLSACFPVSVISLIRTYVCNVRLVSGVSEISIPCNCCCPTHSALPRFIPPLRVQRRDPFYPVYLHVCAHMPFLVLFGQLTSDYVSSGSPTICVVVQCSLDYLVSSRRSLLDDFCSGDVLRLSPFQYLRVLCPWWRIPVGVHPYFYRNPSPDVLLLCIGSLEYLKLCASSTSILPPLSLWDLHLSC